MKPDLLVIFENEQVLPDALTFTREFALRIDARVTLLMLVSMSFTASDFLGVRRNVLKTVQARAGTVLAEVSDGFARSGIRLSSTLAIGDPAEDLLKFLAGRPPFQAIVWGSDEILPSAGKRGGKHWLEKVKSRLECPLLTVTRRTRAC